jgi:hypothetical protein
MGRLRYLLFRGRIVLGAEHWIGQHVIGLLQVNELFCIAGLRVVRMKAARKKLKDAVDCGGLGIGADLEEFVVILRYQNSRHGGSASPLRLRRVLSAPSQSWRHVYQK